MYRLLKTLKIKSDIQTAKELKIAETNAYLKAHRKASRPQVPIGFKSRNSSAYYLTTHHKF